MKLKGPGGEDEGPEVQGLGDEFKRPGDEDEGVMKMKALGDEDEVPRW